MAAGLLRRCMHLMDCTLDEDRAIWVNAPTDRSERADMARNRTFCMNIIDLLLVNL